MTRLRFERTEAVRMKRQLRKDRLAACAFGAFIFIFYFGACAWFSWCDSRFF